MSLSFSFFSSSFIVLRNQGYGMTVPPIVISFPSFHLCLQYPSIGFQFFGFFLIVRTRSPLVVLVNTYYYYYFVVIFQLFGALVRWLVDWLVGWLVDILCRHRGAHSLPISYVYLFDRLPLSNQLAAAEAVRPCRRHHCPSWNRMSWARRRAWAVQP